MRKTLMLNLIDDNYKKISKPYLVTIIGENNQKETVKLIKL